MFKLVLRQSSLFLLLLAFIFAPLISISQEKSDYLSKYRTDDRQDWLREREAYYLNNTGLPNDTLSANYTKGLQCFKHEKYKEAIEYLKKAKGINDRTIKSWKSNSSDQYYPDMLIGFCYSLLKVKDSAVEYYKKCINDYPDFEEPYIEMARLCIDYQDYDTAIMLCDNYLLKNPNSFNILYTKSMIYFERGWYNHASKELKQAIKLKPDDPHLNLLLGEIYKIQYKSGKQFVQYNKVISLDSTILQAFINRGIWFFQNDMIDKALLDFKTATHIDSTNGKAYLLTAITIFTLGDVKEAIPFFSKYITIAKQDTGVYYSENVGHLEFNELVLELNNNNELNDDEQLAGILLVKLITGNYTELPFDEISDLLNKNSESLYITRIYNYLLFKRHGNKISNEYLNRILAQKPDLITANMMLASIYERIHQDDKAIEIISQVIEHAPYYTDAYMQRVNLYFDNNELSKIYADLDKVKKLNPYLRYVDYYYAQAYKKSGLIQQALNTYLELLQTKSSISTIYLSIAYCYYDLDNIDSALSNVNRFLSNNGTSMSGYSLKGDIYYRLKNYQEAEVNYSKAIDNYFFNSKDKAVDYYKRALCYYMMTDQKKSIRDLKVSTSINENYPEANHLFGDIYLTNGDYEKSIEYNSKAVANKAYYFEAMYQIAQAKLLLGNTEEANKYYMMFAKNNIRHNDTINSEAYEGLQEMIDNNIMTQEAKEILEKLNGQLTDH